MSEGISHAQAEMIAQRVVAPVRNDVHHLKEQVRELEAEMGRIASAISSMSSSMAEKLSALKTVNDQLLDAQRASTRETVNTLQTVNATNSQGFQQMSTDLGSVDGSLKQMSQALVQMEVIRQMHEVKTPAEQAERFQEEIEQRFLKAVENVAEVRKQFDAMQLRVADDLDKKFRHIGSHIYRVFEEDFEEFAESPLSAPFDATIALALEVDIDAIDRRATALESTLAQFDVERLQPLLSAQSELEHLFASRYTVDGLDADACFIPISVCERIDEGRPIVSVYADTSTSISHGADSASHVEIRMSNDGREVASRVERMVRDRFYRLPKRPLRDDERQEIREAIGRMADLGRIPADLLPGYLEVLDSANLEILDEGEVK